MSLPRLRRLADDVRFELEYEDDTPFGSTLGGGVDLALRRDCVAIRQVASRAEAVRRSEELLALTFSRDLASRYRRPGVLREECLYPPAERVRPRALVVTREQRVLGSVALPESSLGELAPWISELQRGARRPNGGVGRALFDAFDACGALAEQAEPDPEALDADVVFIGHATALLGRAERVLVDPFVLPTSGRYPPTYQPWRYGELPPLAAVAITHSHPDHFDLSTLLRLGADAPIYVPEVERESLLAIDMARRLEQLGFSRVHRLRPGQVISLGESVLRAHPFFGEQPTTGECLHPEVRNVGCTYSLESAAGRVFVIADSGRDRAGDVADLAGALRREQGEVDVLFGGYRGFALYPIQYLFSSVSRYLLFVPQPDWAARQVCMNDGDALLDTAERCGAKCTVPYADGGAPWYWERGLGPRLDGSGAPRLAIDPPPEEVLRRAAARSSSETESIASPALVSLLRPTEGLARRGDGSFRVERAALHRWPFGARQWHQHNVALVRAGGSAIASARAVFRALAPALLAWRSSGRLACFFFMRKPPDLRLRFLGDAELSHEVEAILHQLTSSGQLERAFASVYEPEIERFGGAEAMEAVHAWFDADTAAWMTLDALAADGRALIAAEVLVSAVAADLVARTLADRAETMALWQRYSADLGLADSGEVGPPVDELATLASRAGVELTPVLESYLEANRALAEALASSWHAGTLSTGLRSVVGAVVLFHLHRHGLDAEGHARVARGMQRRLGASSNPG